MPGIAKEILPPFLYRKLTQPSYKSTKLYGSYAEALLDCSQDAYENQELVEVIRKKTARYAQELASRADFSVDFRSSIMLNAVVTAAAGRKKLRVLDFGGACGAHFFEVKKVLGDRIALEWVVVETTAMAAEGKKLETAGLYFTDDIWKAVEILGEVDLLHTSGTLQCVDAPFEFLQRMLSVKPAFILFNRLGLHAADQTIIVVHKSKLSWNGIGELPDGYTDKWLAYPFQFLSQQTFESKMNEAYHRLFSYVEESGIFPVNEEKLIGRAYLYERKD
jgi:putative methyltransferase (TIGR04325 family)